MTLVRPTLVTLEEIDAALVARLSNVEISLMGVGPVTLPVYIEDSIPVIDRVFPCISVELQEEREDFDRAESSYGVYVAGRSTASPAVVSMEEEPECVQLIYQIKGWVNGDSAACRELNRKMRGILSRRTYLDIPKRESGDVERKLWLFQEGSTTFLKERDEAELILQLIWTYSVLCELATGTGTTEKEVLVAEFGMWQGVDKDEKYRSFSFDETTFTPK